MASNGPPDHAVRAGEDVDIEIRVDFQGGKNHKIQLIHRRCSQVAGIVGGADLMMEVVLLQRFGRIQVKALHIQNPVNESLLIHGCNLPCNATQGEAAAHMPVQHLLPQEPGCGQRCAAGAHLHGEAVIEIPRSFNHICRRLSSPACSSQ